MTPARLFLLAALATAPALFAGEPLKLAAPPPSYTVECWMVHVPARLAVALVPELRDETRAAAGWQKLQAMIARGEATLADCLSAQGVEGQRFKTASIGENRVMTEMEDACLPPLQPLTPQRRERMQHWPHVGFVPTNFDTREVGPRMELALTRTTDPKLLECDLGFHHVQLPHDRKFDAGPLPTGERLSYTLTDFTDLHNRVQLLVESGRPKLVGVHRLPGANTFEVVMLTVAARPAASTGHAAGEPRWAVRTEVQMVALPQAQARALVPKLRDATTFPAADARLQEMLAAGEAELLGWPMAEGFVKRSPITKDPLPEIAASASKEEIRYPTEFSALQLPGHGWPMEGYAYIPFTTPGPIHAPTAIDTRNAGLALVVNARIDRQGNLDLRLSVNLTRLVAMDPAIGAREDRPARPSIEQPQFHDLKTHAKLLVQRETHRLLGVFTNGQPQPRVILFLLHARVQPAPLPL